MKKQMFCQTCTREALISTCPGNRRQTTQKQNRVFANECDSFENRFAMLFLQKFHVLKTPKQTYMKIIYIRRFQRQFVLFIRKLSYWKFEDSFDSSVFSAEMKLRILFPFCTENYLHKSILKIFCPLCLEISDEKWLQEVFASNCEIFQKKKC